MLRDLICCLALVAIVIGSIPTLARAASPDRQIAVIAHNMGDDLRALDLAWVRAADAIEIDVIDIDGELIAQHPVSPLDPKILATPAPRLPLEEAWAAALPAGTIQLDLKSTGPAALQRVVAFLRAHIGEAQVLVTSREPIALAAIATHAPGVCRYLSVATSSGLEALLEDPNLVASLDGVSIVDSLLDRGSFNSLRAANLRIAAWTVNDVVRAEELVAWGVEAITTDNPEIALTLSAESQQWTPCDRAS